VDDGDRAWDLYGVWVDGRFVDCLSCEPMAWPAWRFRRRCGGGFGGMDSHARDSDMGDGTKLRARVEREPLGHSIRGYHGRNRHRVRACQRASRGGSAPAKNPFAASWPDVSRRDVRTHHPIQCGPLVRTTHIPSACGRDWVGR